jgi:PAS domain S-box-containing protein
MSPEPPAPAAPLRARLHSGRAQATAHGLHIKLRTYFAGLLVVFVLAALAGVFYVRNQTAQNARTQALGEAAFAAKSAAKVLAEGAGILQGALGGVANDPSIAAILAHPSQCRLSFSQVGAFPTGHIDILRPTGAVVCTSRPGAAPGRSSYVGQRWVSSASSAPLALAPVRDAATGQEVALFSVPLHHGIVAAFLDLDAVGPSLATQLAGPAGLRYIVTSADGKVDLARSTPAAQSVGHSIVQTAFYRDAGTSQRPDLGGTTRLFAESTVPGLGWRVYAGIDRSVALNAASQLYQRELLIIVAALLVVLAATAVVQRRIARPIAQLSAAVRERPAATEPVVAPLRAPAEVMDLAESFDGLVGRLEAELVERRRAEEAAREAEREATATAAAYRDLFHDHPQPMWIYDEETLEIFEVNESALQHYGYRREEFLAMTLKDLRPADDIPELLESVARAAPRDASGPWRHVKRDGSVIEVEIVSHTVQFRGRRGRLIVATDITERQRLARQLDQVRRLESLGQLAGGVAHDFNNLLGVIMNYAAFVREELATADPDRWGSTRADVEQIEQAARRANELTHQLLAFARREVIHPDVISLNDTVRETSQLLRRSLGEHVELTCALEENLWPVLADPGQMEQILVNLAVNARDAMPSGGRLLIETANLEVDESYAAARPGLTPGNYVRLRVSDTGGGMDADTLQHAFEPFFTTKPKGEGTGLGLATIYGIVTQAGGQIRLYSEPGVGTTCTVLLPVTTEEVRPEKPTDEGDLTGEGQVVLVVEDEPGIREVARRILARGGYEVLTAADGAQAIELARNHAGPIDLLITDVIMPRMMGSQVAQAIAAEHPGTGIMFMSGYAHPLVGSTQELAPDTLLIEKPFTERTMLVKVREALRAAPGSQDA